MAFGWPIARTTCDLPSFGSSSLSSGGGFVWSSCVLNAPLAIAAPWPRGESGEGSAPQRVAVEDVQRILSEDKGKSEAKVARQLSGLELTERMSYTKLKSLEQNVPGKKSRWALVALADASVFLSPP